MNRHTSDAHAQARRRLMKVLAATGGAFATATVLPTRWTRPLVDSLMIPLHAQTSPVQLVIGPFTSSSEQGSIFDFLVQPLHAAAPPGDIAVGNATFDLDWELDSCGYTVCGNGLVGTSNTFVAVTINGGAARTDNDLNDYAEKITGGVFELVGQHVTESGITFTAIFRSDKTGGVAGPGAGGCSVNSSTSLRMSSPYPESGQG